MKTATIALMLISLPVFATGSHSTPGSTTRADSESTAVALAGAEAESQASALAAQQQAQRQTQTSEQTTNARQTNEQRTVYVDSSSVLYAPSVIPPECGVGGNAGGARGGDSAFMGVAWTTERCYSFRAAAVWAQLGVIDLACEMLADATRKQLKRRGITNLDCTAIAARLHKQAAASSAPPADSISRTEVTEMVNRAFKASAAK